MQVCGRDSLKDADVTSQAERPGWAQVRGCTWRVSGRGLAAASGRAWSLLSHSATSQTPLTSSTTREVGLAGAFCPHTALS